VSADSQTKYAFSDDMGEISGFGGSYEDACRRMVVAGLEWLDAHPESAPKFSEYKNVFGVINEEGEDAKALMTAMVAPAPDCTGAMVHACVHHLLYIRKNGWAAYVEQSKKRKSEEAA
jgi:hypothetical protein